MTDVVRLKPLEYVHVHDSNTSVTYLLIGPCTYTVPQHETLAFKEPKRYISVPPRHYALIECPVLRDAKSGDLVRDKHGQVRTALGEKEIRFEQEPFPLYPNEVLREVKALMVLESTQSIVLRAARDFSEKDQSGASVSRNAGDEWLFRGPGTYVPRVEHEFVEKRDAIIVKTHESLKLRARNKHVDATGVERSVGEEYLWSREGAYTLSVDEQLINVVPAKILTAVTALHVEVVKAFTDTRPWARGVERKPGQVYMVTADDTTAFTPFPSEKIATTTNLVTVNKLQYAVILDPVIDGVQQFGRRQVVTNRSLFLQPGERLEAGVQNVYVLAEDEGIVLTAIEEFSDGKAGKRVPGDAWLLTGPLEYIPHASVRVQRDKNGAEKRKRIVLADGEGVYVRNCNTGEVRAVIGEAFMLAAHEELWEKELPKVVEEKLQRQGDSHTAYMEKRGVVAKRDKTRVVRYVIPHNAITQVYDYKKRTQRTIFGPDAVLLGPDEEFSVLSLSGSEWDPARPNVCLPKKTGRIKALYLFLGPSTLTDVLEVETSDHARLELQLSYDWHFDVEVGDAVKANECFSVPDFVGDCCSCIASRIRANVAGISFDNFHKHSATLVKGAVFGIDNRTQEPKSILRFPSNRLVVTSVDVQGIEVLDEKTRNALNQSVKMAIEITTQSQEAGARQEASVREQQARGMLETQVIQDKARAEGQRKSVIELESQSAAIASSGQAKAEARARSDASEIEAQTTVRVAQIKATTQSTLENMTLESKKQKQLAELEGRSLTETEELAHKKAVTDIESGKFARTMNAIGKDTVKALARAGPELQARLLKSLGLEGYLVTDGTNPINLFNAAQGMTAAPTR